jgi:hypothetical protein
MMAFFSRGKRAPQPADPTAAATPAEPEARVETTPAPAESAAEQPEALAVQASEAASTEQVPDAAAEASVPISVSAYRGLNATPPRRPAPETAPVPKESVSGLRDNVVVVAALARITGAPTTADLIDVGRQLMQGHLFLRIKGDVRSLLSQGRPVPFALATVGEKRYVVAYSSGGAMQASVREDGDGGTSAMGQPVLSVLRAVLAGPHDGLLLDPSSAPARAILSRDLIEKMVDGADPELTIKSLLVAERTAATASSVAFALANTKFWIAVNRVGDTGKLGIAEGRSPEGERFIELYSHPLEVVALGRGDQPAPMTGEQLGKALAVDDQLAGAIVDPGGPWIRLSREDLLSALPG